ncbi:MAG TPA: arylamine N-acetyltransferase [Gemmatimonadaceae bacterium]
MDLDAYLRRIDYRGAREPTLAVLRAIHEHHTRAIPFENLNPLLGWPVRLDIASLERKLVHERRGGFCFEHNLLLRHALDAIGFRTTGLAARVRWNLPPEATMPRTHMLLLVRVGAERYIADVGFGGMTPTTPLRFEADVEQPTTHEPYRLARAGDAYVMQAGVRGEWKSLYQFDLQEQALEDYQMASWYLTHHPDSRFVTGLIASRVDRGRRHVLRNAELATHVLHGETERRALASAAELRGVLKDTFHLDLPDDPELDAALEWVVARGAAGAEAGVGGGEGASESGASPPPRPWRRG